MTAGSWYRKYNFVCCWQCEIDVIIIFQNKVDVLQIVKKMPFLSGLAITYCRLWCFWMNTLFSQPIHHTAGNIVLQHLVFRLFLCSKHCWYKTFVLHPTMCAKPHYCSLFLEGFFTHLKCYCCRINYVFLFYIQFESLKVSFAFIIYSTWMLRKWIIIPQQRLRDNYTYCIADLKLGHVLVWNMLRTFWAQHHIGHLRLQFNIPTGTNSLWSERTTSKVISSLHRHPRENYFSREQMVLVSSLPATKTNWRETFNHEHKENCWSSFKPLKSFNIDSSAEWKRRIWLIYWWKWNGWERGFLWYAKHKIIDFLNSINSKSKEAGGGGTAHFDCTNSCLRCDRGKKKSNSPC